MTEQTNQFTEIKTQSAGFFQDDNGNQSAIRLASFTALISAIIFGLITTLDVGGQGSEGVYITFGFLLSAFIPKTLQKFNKL